MKIRFWEKHKSDKNKTDPAASEAKKGAPIPSDTLLCARCKKQIRPDEAVRIGQHWFCKDCAKPKQTTSAEAGRNDKCAACFLPLSENNSHVWEGKRYCYDCFTKKVTISYQRGDRNTAYPPGAGSGAQPQFEGEDFEKQYQQRIASRTPKYINDPGPQKRLLRNLSAAFPALYSELQIEQRMQAMETGQLNLLYGVQDIAYALNALLNFIDLNKEDRWSRLSTDQLIDACILLDHYIRISKPEDAVNLSNARSFAGMALRRSLLLEQLSRVLRAAIPPGTEIKGEQDKKDRRDEDRNRTPEEMKQSEKQKMTDGTDTAAADDVVAVPRFDRDTFIRDHHSAIKPRIPADIEDVDTQKRLLSNLEEVIPTVNTLLVARDDLIGIERGSLDANTGIGRIAFRVNNLLGVTKLENIIKKWDAVTDDHLLDAFILLDFYTFALKPEFSGNIGNARAFLADEIRKRVPKDADRNKPVSAIKSGVLAQGIDYAFGYRPESDIYFVEFHDYTGEFLEDKTATTRTMGYASFLLTEEEYELLSAHPDDIHMADLLEKLLVDLPKDRLIKIGSMDLLTNKTRDLDVELKNETVDDGVYPKYREQRTISYINSLDKLYVIFARATGDRFPSIDFSGSAWVFSKKEYAENVIRQNTDGSLFCREFTGDGFRAFIQSFYRYGIVRFKLNPGTNDRYLQIERDRFLPMEKGKGNYAGAALNQLILRFRQYNAIQNNPEARAMAMTMWGVLCHELYRSVFLVPFSYENESGETEDRVIHTSLQGAQRMTHLEIENQLGERVGENRKLAAEHDDGSPAYLLNKELLFGSEKYHFATEDDKASPGKTMHFRTVMKDGTAFMCGFTDFDALHAFFGEHVRVAVFAYEEIIAPIFNADGPDSGLAGFVINPGTNELTLSREHIQHAEKEKDEPGIFYMPEDRKQNG